MMNSDMSRLKRNEGNAIILAVIAVFIISALSAATLTRAVDTLKRQTVERDKVLATLAAENAINNGLDRMFRSGSNFVTERLPARNCQDIRASVVRAGDGTRYEQSPSAAQGTLIQPAPENRNSSGNELICSPIDRGSSGTPVNLNGVNPVDGQYWLHVTGGAVNVKIGLPCTPGQVVTDTEGTITCPSSGVFPSSACTDPAPPVPPLDPRPRVCLLDGQRTLIGYGIYFAKGSSEKRLRVLRQKVFVNPRVFRFAMYAKENITNSGDNKLWFGALYDSRGGSVGSNRNITSSSTGSVNSRPSGNVCGSPTDQQDTGPSSPEDCQRYDRLAGFGEDTGPGLSVSPKLNGNARSDYYNGRPWGYIYLTERPGGGDYSPYGTPFPTANVAFDGRVRKQASVPELPLYRGNGEVLRNLRVEARKGYTPSVTEGAASPDGSTYWRGSAASLEVALQSKSVNDYAGRVIYFDHTRGESAEDPCTIELSRNIELKLTKSLVVVGCDLTVTNRIQLEIQGKYGRDSSQPLRRYPAILVLSNSHGVGGTLRVTDVPSGDANQVGNHLRVFSQGLVYASNHILFTFRSCPQSGSGGGSGSLTEALVDGTVPALSGRARAAQDISIFTGAVVAGGSINIQGDGCAIFNWSAFVQQTMVDHLRDGGLGTYAPRTQSQTQDNNG